MIDALSEMPLLSPFIEFGFMRRALAQRTGLRLTMRGVTGGGVIEGIRVGGRRQVHGSA